MICEEASETLEAHIISALTPTIQHLILIGDHQQLRPSMSVHDLKDLNIDVSLFERLVTNHFPFSMLDCQRRMRPEIRKLIRPIYNNLWDHDSVCHYDNVRGMVDNVSFLTTLHFVSQLTAKCEGNRRITTHTFNFYQLAVVFNTR